MKNIFAIVLLSIFLGILFTGVLFANDEIDEVEPNNFFNSAMEIPLGHEFLDVKSRFDSVDDIDVYSIELSADSIYHFYSDSSDIESSTHVELFFEGDTTLNILAGSPDGRGWQNNFRIAGWSPQQYGSGKYYLKLNAPLPITGEYTGSYRLRVISQNLNHWANLHEPDNTFQEAFGQFPLPIDGNRYTGMCYNLGDLPTGKDDIDLFYMVGEQGKRLWVETEPVQGYPYTRDMDSKIYIYDGDGNELLTDNDDKSNQEEDFGSNNVFSLTVIDSLPYSGLYYVIMTSYYAAYNNEGVTQHSDSDPSTGGYVAYAWMGDGKAEVEPNDGPETATALVEKVTGSRIGADNNLLIDGAFSGDGDVDWYAINMKTTKMYSINTVNSSVAENVKVEVYNRNDPSTNLIDDSVEGRYNDNDFRLSGWIPPENGIYLIKLSPSSGSVAGENTGEYQLRIGWATWARHAEWGEPGNNEQVMWENTKATAFYGAGANHNQVAVDSSITYATIYPAGDEDWYWFDGSAGDIIHVETFSGLDLDGSWGRDLDTKIMLVDPSGNVLENDDFRPEGERHPGNTFSAVAGYTLQATGTVWIKVEGYYKDMGSAGKNPIGNYRLLVYSSASAPEFAEKESNNTFALAMPVPEDKDVKAKFSSAADVDIFAFKMITTRMYFVNSYDGDFSETIHAELYAAADTTINVFGDDSIDGRYNDGNFRLSGFIPPADGTYYLKLTNANPGIGKYTIRARSSLIEEVASFHEPDNTIEEADLRGNYPVDGVIQKGGLYNPADPDKFNDVDIYRFTLTAGQMFVAELFPVGGETWYRDTDTYMTLESSTPSPWGSSILQESDDKGGGNVYSIISLEIPADDVYYLKVYGFYSTINEEVASFNDPGVGDYMIKVSGTMSESEPNNTAEQANMVPVTEHNLIEASFAADDLDDWYKVSLEAGKLYYFNSADSKVAEDIQVELFAADNTASNLVNNSTYGRSGSADFRISGWTPAATGEYLLHLSIPVGALNDQNNGSYKLRAAGGEVLAEVALIHEPDNSIAQANAVQALPTDGTMVDVAFGDNDDHDMFAISGVAGQSLEVVTAPAHGPRWIRELDTKIRLLKDDSTAVGDNDDWDDWYELEFYMGEVSNTYSRVFVENLPYTGTYYIDAFPYYGNHNGNDQSIGNNAVGSYKIWAKMLVVTSVEDENALPTTFALENNYPNPFNPTTTIEYSLPKVTDVKITIFNVRGQLVTTIVNTQQAQGAYRVLWNAMDDFGNRVSSGMYFYRIEAGDFIKTKKMLLMK